MREARIVYNKHRNIWRIKRWRFICWCWWDNEGGPYEYRSYEGALRDKEFLDDSMRDRLEKKKGNWIDNKREAGKAGKWYGGAD